MRGLLCCTRPSSSPAVIISPANHVLRGCGDCAGWGHLSALFVLDIATRGVHPVIGLLTFRLLPTTPKGAAVKHVYAGGGVGSPILCAFGDTTT